MTGNKQPNLDPNFLADQTYSQFSEWSNRKGITDEVIKSKVSGLYPDANISDQIMNQTVSIVRERLNQSSSSHSSSQK